MRPRSLQELLQHLRAKLHRGRRRSTGQGHAGSRQQRHQDTNERHRSGLSVGTELRTQPSDEAALSLSVEERQRQRSSAVPGEHYRRRVPL